MPDIATQKHIAPSVRLAYANFLVACADTVTVLTPQEVVDIRHRAISGEFDADIHLPKSEDVKASRRALAERIWKELDDRSYIDFHYRRDGLIAAAIAVIERVLEENER